MAETFVHKDGEHIRVEVEALQNRYGASRAAIVWWMTKTSHDFDTAKDEVFQLLKVPDYPDYEHAAAIAAYFVKERLTS